VVKVAVTIPAWESAVVVAVGQAATSLLLLARDERLAGFALGVERVEFLVEAFFRTLAGVDCAPHGHGG
jgi:hypothetical protein